MPSVEFLSNMFALFGSWYTKNEIVPNITTIVMYGSPSGRGRKGGRSKRKRNRKQVSDEPVLEVFNSTCSSSSHINEHSIPSAVQSPVTPSLQSVQSLLSFNTDPSVNMSFTQSNIMPQYQFTLSPHSVVPHVPYLPYSHSPGSSRTNRFYFKFICGNIRICQGCKHSLRMTNDTIPPPPYDLAIARLERRKFRGLEEI